RAGRAVARPLHGVGGSGARISYPRGGVIRTAHTSELDSDTLRAARALLEAAFDGELTAQDWDNCLGGIHALAWEDDELVGHAAVIQRRLVHAGRALRAGYVEGVG